MVLLLFSPAQASIPSPTSCSPRQEPFGHVESPQMKQTALQVKPLFGLEGVGVVSERGPSVPGCYVLCLSRGVFMYRARNAVVATAGGREGVIFCGPSKLDNLSAQGRTQ